MTGTQPPAGRHSRTLTTALRIALAGALCFAAVVLIACGSSGKGLLSAANAGPLKNDIEAVDIAAQEGNGNCTKTEAALQRTEQDFAALPSSTNAGLRDTLRQGITNLRKVATELCTQPLVNTTTTPTAPSTTTPTTTPTKTTPSTEERAEKEKVEKEKAATEEKAGEESETSAGAGGGTPAPGEDEGKGKSPSEGVGGVTPEGGNGAGGQESK